MPLFTFFGYVSICFLEQTIGPNLCYVKGRDPIMSKKDVQFYLRPYVCTFHSSAGLYTWRQIQFYNSRITWYINGYIHIGYTWLIYILINKTLLQYERLFFSSSLVPRTANPGGVPPAPRQSDWVEQSDARPSTGASSPGSPVSRCTGLGVHMAWFPSGNPIRVFFHGKVSLSVNPCLPFDRALCQALLAALLPTPR